MLVFEAVLLLILVSSVAGGEQEKTKHKEGLGRPHFPLPLQSAVGNTQI